MLSFSVTTLMDRGQLGSKSYCFHLVPPPCISALLAKTSHFVHPRQSICYCCKRGCCSEPGYNIEVTLCQLPSLSEMTLRGFQPETACKISLAYILILIFTVTMGICFPFLTPQVEESKGWGRVVHAEPNTLVALQ